MPRAPAAHTSSYFMKGEIACWCSNSTQEGVFIAITVMTVIQWRCELQLRQRQPHYEQRTSVYNQVLIDRVRLIKCANINTCCWCPNNIKWWTDVFIQRWWFWCKMSLLGHNKHIYSWVMLKNVFCDLWHLKLHRHSWPHKVKPQRQFWPISHDPSVSWTSPVTLAWSGRYQVSKLKTLWEIKSCDNK